MSRRDRKRGRRGGPPSRPGRRGGRSARPAPLDERRVLRALSGKSRPLRSVNELLDALGLGRDAARRLRALLKRLESDGAIERVAGRFRRPRPDGLVEGVFTPAAGADPRGGSVVDDAGEVWRVVAADGARAGDRVLLQPLPGRGRGRGEILDVVGGQRDVWVGIYQRRGERGLVTPYRDDGDWAVAIDRGCGGGARDGDVVVVAPAPAPVPRSQARGRRRSPRPPRPAGRVVEVVGRPGDPDADCRAVIWRRRLPTKFPDAVVAEAEAIPAELSAAELSARLDLRDQPFLTIDPASARDHDDAVFVGTGADGGGRLWVAIADVSHFVPEGSAIDREALRRGNSVYFPDRAIPMLPERLSGDLCSLRPGVDRCVRVVELAVDDSGGVSRRDFHAAVIRSRARLTYEQAAEVMEGGAGDGLDPEVAEQLRRLARVAARLRRARLAGGAIDLELPEPQIRYGEDGRPCDVQAAPRSVAHRAVEDAMLAANRAVAEALVAAAQPAVHRNHAPPTARDSETLREIFAVFGLAEAGDADVADGAAPPPAWVAAAVARAAGTPEERLVNQVVLRCMSRAHYGARPAGHYALAFRHYTHFTSPIRRYADLVVHRALIELGERGARGPDAAVRRQRAWMQRVAGRISWRERVAVDAEREVMDLQRCALMSDHVGEVHDATVTGVAPFGLWMTLDRWFVEGLVHVSSLPDFVEFDERRFALTVRRSGERFELGDRFSVRIAAVDGIQARIDFRPVKRLGDGPQRASSKRSRSPRSL